MAKVHENKQAIAAILIALILVVGAVFVFMKTQKPTAVNDLNGNKPLNTVNPKVEDIVKVIKSGKNTQCNFENFNNEDSSTSGVVYVSGENMRFDATTYVDGTDNDIFLLKKGDSNYIWGTQFPKNTGLQMEATLDKMLANPQAQQYLNVGKYKYSCKDWVVDPAAFQMPENVKFTDVMGLMKLMANPSR